AVAGDRANEMLAASSRGFSGQSDMNLHKNAAAYFSGKSKGKGESQKIDYEKIEASYINDGFLCEKIPYYREDFALHLYDSMTSEEIEKLQENIKHVNIWKITVNPEYKDETNTDSPSCEPMDTSLPFAVTSDLNEGIFTVRIQGRVDTITAPELLKKYKETEGKFTEIKIDVSRMPYVSSAGLRVFMMMYKSLPDKDKFEMTGISKDVREIFETTGFDEFFIH
ncbi:MAG: STAS domain-containing protein, partial [Lachnospiraceae bacterium]|nr:STAS domain-containing protein [Lachnospiraceae bacterium]